MHYRCSLALFLGAACALPGNARADSPEEQLAAASALFDAKKYDQAAPILDAFLAKNPGHAKAGVAAFVLGRCRSELKQYPAAIAAYSRSVGSKDQSVATQAELGLAEAAMQTSQYDKAADALQDAVKGTLKPAQAAVAYYYLGQADYNLKRYGPAREAYDHVVNDFGKSEFAGDALYGSALSAYQDNKPDDARQRLRSFTDKYPRSPTRGQAFLLLAQIDLNGKNYADARREFEAALNDPAVRQEGGSLRANAEDGLIQTLLTQEDYKQAAPLLEVVMARLGPNDPQRYRAAFSLGNARYHEKEYDRALAAYLIAADAKEAAVAAPGLYWAANAQLGLDHPADAAAQFAKLVTRFPNDKLASRAQLKAGDAFAQAKQTREASTAYQAVLDKYPQSPEAATARQNLSQLVGALDDPVQITNALKNAPPAEKSAGMLRVARIYLSGKKVPEAVAVLNDVLKTNPTAQTGGEAQYLLGLAYDSQQKSAPAALALAEATRLTPQATWALSADTRLAELYLEMKQPDKAEKAAAAALDLKPDEQAAQQIRLTQTQAFLDEKKWDEAFADCQTLLTNHPSPETAATALYTQAWVREQQKKPDDALTLWDKLANDYPASDYAADALLRLGDGRSKAEKYAEAGEKYTQLLTRFPKSPLAPEARFKRGSALFNSGKAEDAFGDFQAVADDKTAGSYQPEGLYWAGVALDKAGKKDEAIQRLTTLVTTYPTSPRVANAKIRLAALKAVAGK